MAHSIAKAYKKNKTDELYTPPILVEAISPYLKQLYTTLTLTLKRKPIIGLPFDTQDSEFAIFCKKNHYEYVCSHIGDGKDFFDYEPKLGDIALSNPPFSRKLEVFKRLNSFHKPGAMVTNIMCLNYQEIGNYFVENPCQLLIVDKRVSFDGNPSSFNSSYICGNHFLPKDLIFIHLDNNNAKNKFKPSHMYLKK